MNSIRIDALASVGEGRAASNVAYNAVIDRSTSAARSARQSTGIRLQHVAERAAGTVQQARGNAQALMREVAGQGPEKTLTRGFAIVRNDDGKPVTSSAEASASPKLNIQFRDGMTIVHTDPIPRMTP
jgi:exodeoxyribonuclease VII large subunit